ncbi:hypothetical protein JR316_0000945 [Psilocybe cubensis]|uniref:Uncharacterized protein n=2 Tax=Psilocybe cubensis TaxID=181762 RepID=A0ACB8HFU8_PSICU|nr:hypothetical protein JR316_0000945 [Psilocybe cubensis]KAH9486880.1 hypothetical protein JR316_0000945 [Psilocybe cubensis]
MWPFIITRTYVFSKVLPASKEEILQIVHDPIQSIQLSPLCQDAKADPNDPKWFTVTEMLPLLGGLLESKTTIRCGFENDKDGRYTEVFAGLGTHMDSTVRVEEVNEGTKYTEVVVLKASQPALFRWITL